MASPLDDGGETPRLSSHDNDRQVDQTRAEQDHDLFALSHRYPPAATSDAAPIVPRRVNPRRSNTDPVESSTVRNFSRTFARRSVAEEDKTHGLQNQHVLRTIPSRDPMSDAQQITAGQTGQHDTAKPTNALATASSADDKALRSLRATIRQMRPGKGKSKKKGLLKLTLKERMAAIVAVMYHKIIIEGLLRRKPLPSSVDGRHVPLNSVNVGPNGLIDERSQKPYISNFIRSSRYTLYDFVPKQLMFQFSKLGNFYFLVMGILQMIPGLSTVGRWTTIVPLGLFVAFSMAKEGYDDYRRYQLDKSENRSETWVLEGGSSERPRSAKMAETSKTKMPWKKPNGDDSVGHNVDLESGTMGSHGTLGCADDWMRVQWQHVKVGDVVRLRRNDGIPADMVLLHATGPNGIAYIETMALDGETNLKSKQD